MCGLPCTDPVEAAVSRIENANRTCSIFVGVGSAKEDFFDVIEYSYEEVNVYNDTNFPAYPPDHDLMDGVVFVDKHTQPSHDPCLNDLLKMYYGDIDPLVTLRNITAVFQTGDMVRCAARRMGAHAGGRETLIPAVCLGVGCDFSTSRSTTSLATP